MVSKIKLKSDPGSRLALIFGAGEQIATSHYHSYNHGLIFTAACLLNVLPSPATNFLAQC
jgi:hypothetical protein